MKSGSGAIFDNGTQEPFSPLSLSKKSTIANHATQQELHVHQREMRREVVQVLNIILLDIDFAAGDKKFDPAKRRNVTLVSSYQQKPSFYLRN